MTVQLFKIEAERMLARHLEGSAYVEPWQLCLAVDENGHHKGDAVGKASQEFLRELWLRFNDQGIEIVTEHRVPMKLLSTGEWVEFVEVVA